MEFKIHSDDTCFPTSKLVVDLNIFYIVNGEVSVFSNSPLVMNWFCLIELFMMSQERVK